MKNYNCFDIVKHIMGSVSEYIKAKKESYCYKVDIRETIEKYTAYTEHKN